MKKFVALVMMLFGFQLTNGQAINVNGVDSFFNLEKDVSEDDSSSEVLGKKYLTKGFKPASIDDESKVFFLRFNIYRNQMEFAKDAGVYNMNKAVGTRVHFRTLDATYECFDFDGRLTFLKVYDNTDSNKLRLVTKESIRYIKAEKALHGYDVDKPAKYVRSKDQQFFVIDNKMVEVPRKKKSFFAYFESDANNIKDFVKKEKLSYKKVKDINKIIAHYNEFKNIK